jgi:3-methyladenine DNA glycosylase/8-oxoguanine DNA glycosylase
MVSVIEPSTAAKRLVRLDLPVDLGLTLWPMRRGFGDPTMRADPDGSWWRASATPDGPATTRFAPSGDGVLVEAWGPGAPWALEAAPDLLGARDSLDGFDPPCGPIRELHRRMPGLRITRSRAVFEALVPTVIEQKIAGKLARAAYRAMVHALGEPAPGPGRLRVPPSPEVLAATPYFVLHRFGIEMRRAGVIRELARRAPRLDRLTELNPREARDRLASFPGLGPWSAGEVSIIALGDADAVSVGDYHLPHSVAWLLAGEPRATDDRMLELLEPFAGHRGRVLRLITASGIGAPRFGPRQPLRRIARI